MKKILNIAALMCCALLFFCGCGKQTNYSEYISEKRTDIYLYSDDGLQIKIYVSEKETPYCADGFKGEMGFLTEIYVTLPKNPDEVNVKAGNIEGEMNFRAVENCYYLSAANGDISGESASVTLTIGEESKTYSAMNVKYDGVISCEDALKCVLERDLSLFEGLTESGIFCGEIYVRLIFDDGCYYYVGVCDRDKKITAYLVDGVKGKIIATKELNG